MAKTPKRRSDTLRLRNKWLQLLKKVDPARDLKCITFGRVFSKDPFDCGIPNCPLCSYNKALDRRRDRKERRRQERLAEFDLD